MCGTHKGSETACAISYMSCMLRGCRVKCRLCLMSAGALDTCSAVWGQAKGSAGLMGRANLGPLVDAGRCLEVVSSKAGFELFVGQL